MHSALFLLSWIPTRRSPLFVFALFNAIIAALLAQYARLSASDHRTSHSEPQAEHRHNQLITDRAITDTCTDNGSCAAADSGSNFRSQRVFQRIRSEKLEEDEGRTTERKKLRRSETEKAVESSYPQHDKLSNEEFRQTIEAFIARQMSLLREESLAIVLVDGGESDELDVGDRRGVRRGEKVETGEGLTVRERYVCVIVGGG